MDSELRPLHHARRLIPERLRHRKMPTVHLLVGALEFRGSGAVRSDLRGAGTVLAGAREMGFDLLTARAGRVEVLRRIAANFGLAAAPALDLVAERGEAQRELR